MKMTTGTLSILLYSLTFWFKLTRVNLSTMQVELGKLACNGIDKKPVLFK